MSFAPPPLRSPSLSSRDQGDTLRLFLALWPDDATRAALCGWQAAHVWPPLARPTRPDDLHLTLHFIGAVPRVRLAEVETGLAVPARAVDLTLDRAAIWPNHVAVLEPDRAYPALVELQADLAGALQRLGLPLEQRPYRPHVTLARRADGAVLQGTPPPVRWRAAGYVLAESRGGYRVLRRYG